MTADVQITRIERRKMEFREKITGAALKLFEEQGVAETSVASIIKEADIAHKTFFNHFPTKDHLLRHIISDYSGYAYAVFRESFKRYPDPKKSIEYCFLNIAKALDTLNPNFKELLNFYLLCNTAAGDLHKSQRDEFRSVVSQIMLDAKSEGMLRPGFSVDTLTDMVIGICVSVLISWSLEDDFPLVPRMKKAMKFVNASVFIDN